MVIDTQKVVNPSSLLLAKEIASVSRKVALGVVYLFHVEYVNALSLGNDNLAANVADLLHLQLLEESLQSDLQAVNLHICLSRSGVNGHCSTRLRGEAAPICALQEGYNPPCGVVIYL